MQLLEGTCVPCQNRLRQCLQQFHLQSAIDHDRHSDSTLHNPTPVPAGLDTGACHLWVCHNKLWQVRSEACHLKCLIESDSVSVLVNVDQHTIAFHHQSIGMRTTQLTGTCLQPLTMTCAFTHNLVNTACAKAENFRSNKM